jgi:hypothetical protein
MRSREKFKSTGRFTLAARKECCMFRECYRTATVRIREKIKGTDSLTVAVRNEASMLRECYRTATVRETVLWPFFHGSPATSTIIHSIY